MTDTIAVPYDPESCLDQWGWLWDADALIPDWVLCRTFDEDGEVWVEWHAADDTVDTHSAGLAAEWAGTPYLPLARPACEPGAGLLVTVRLPGGASLAQSVETTGPRADEARAAVLAALGLGADPARAAPGRLP